MNLLVPAALAFSVIIPIILLLYFMRPKRQERVIGSTLLWQQALQDLQASRPWQRLRITPLLLLQLLAALFIILVLTRPAIFTNSPISGNTIIILQASASMQATDVAPSRFESAKGSISDFIDAIGPADHISLIAMARTPQVLATQLQDKGQLKAALQRARVTNQSADLEQALSLAGSLAAGQSNTQVLVIGDGHVSSTDQSLATTFPVRYLPIGTDAPNAALMALSSRSLHGKLIAFAQVINYSHQPRAIPVELYVNTDTANKLVGVKTINLQAGASGSVQWDPLPIDARFLHARLVTQDAMTVDHEAWAIVGSSVRGRVLLVTKENSYLQTALRLQPTVNLFETTPDKYTSGVAYDLTVFDGFVPPMLPDGNLFFVNPPVGSYLFGTSGQATGISHIAAGNDPANMLADIDLSSIHVHSGHQLQAALGMQPVINAQESPVLLAGENTNRRVSALNFDLHDSDMALQPAFPILIHNLTNWLLPPPINGDGQVAAGLPVSVQTWPGANQVTITNPEKQTSTIGPPFPAIPYEKTNTIGIYTVAQEVHAHMLNGAFTVNLFSPTQSKLAPARSLPVLHSSIITTSGGSVSRQLREIWPWIAAFLLLILCAEWWLFSRNYKQQPAAGLHQSKNVHQLARKKTVYNRFVNTMQNEWQMRSKKTRKRFVKIKKRINGKLGKPTKRGRHDYI